MRSAWYFYFQQHSHEDSMEDEFRGKKKACLFMWSPWLWLIWQVYTWCKILSGGQLQLWCQMTKLAVAWRMVGKVIIDHALSHIQFHHTRVSSLWLSQAGAVVQVASMSMFWALDYLQGQGVRCLLGLRCIVGSRHEHLLLIILCAGLSDCMHRPPKARCMQCYLHLFLYWTSS